MPVTAVLCPHPPLLLPASTGPAATGPAINGPVGGEILDELRAACRDAVASLLAPGPRRLVVVGPGTRTVWHEMTDRADALTGVLGGLGVPSGGNPRPRSGVPLALVVGGWLLDDADVRQQGPWLELDPDEPARECVRLGVELAGVYDALLVLGDGSSRRGDEPPGGPHPEAEAFDAHVAAALADADGDALAQIEPDRAAEMGAGGRVAWQVLAGWAQRRTTRGRLLYDAAPFGVGYHVAAWSTPSRST